MSASEIVGSLLDLFRTIAWPAVVLALAIIFRDQIKKGAERLIEISPTGGAKFAPPAQIAPKPFDPLQPSEQTRSVAGEASGTKLMQFKANIRNAVPDELLIPWVERIRSELNTTLGESAEDQIEGLMFATASISFQVGHERVYQTIFGSQLQAMTLMNTDFGASREVLMPTYSAARATFPDLYATVSFEQWISYLLNTGLCIIQANGHYTLTPLGRAFLKYILDRHLVLNKAG